ncbi:MAG: AAA family ATPase, partial [Archaeoglobaceae archaeon]
MPIELEKTPISLHGLARVDGVTIEINITQLAQTKNALGIGLQGLLSLKAHAFDDTIQVFKGRCNFLSTSDKQAIAKQIARMRLKQIDKINWDEFIEALSQAVLDKYYEPLQPTRLQPRFENPHIEFLLEPILIKNYPILIYAPGGSGKSLIALLIAFLVKNGIDLNFQRTIEPQEALYLDWELNREEAERRLSMLVPPFEANKVEYPLYLRCLRPLRDCLQDITRIIYENNVKLVIVDSVTPAMNADINDNAAVAEFFQSIGVLTSMDTTVLLLTHVSKAHKEREDGALPIGAVMFENLSRLTWELKYIDTDGALKIALHCRKSNFGKMPSVGIAFHFTVDGVFVERLNDPDALATSKAVTQADTVLSALIEKPMSVTELSEVTGINRDQLWVILSQLKKEGKVENASRGKWQIKNEACVKSTLKSNNDG